ncbi:hypothetical protein BJ989_000388 [Nocardioides perillae]|uniref:Uncharacterized protein n=1 Tax=Nocardioides perillae TaxID=1119534 RepID=A0A7Y9RTY7_9ACTN|nr:hypothetical protein [Nocardioides perillae]
MRVVLGRWHDTPLGPFADAMVERADGHRVLLAPRQEVAHFIAGTYTFDEVRVEPFAVSPAGPHGVRRGARWAVRSPSLTIDLEVGRRLPLGWLLRLVPAPVATAPAWCAVTDPVARRVLRGVRTRGSAGGGREEFYGATDTRAVVAAWGSFDGVDLGALAPLDPPARFGFSSAPPRPSVTAVVTTVVG